MIHLERLFQRAVHDRHRGAGPDPGIVEAKNALGAAAKGGLSLGRKRRQIMQLSAQSAALVVDQDDQAGLRPTIGVVEGVVVGVARLPLAAQIRLNFFVDVCHFAV